MATQNGYTTLYAMEIGDDVDDVVEAVVVEEDSCATFYTPIPIVCFTQHMDDLMGCFGTWVGCNF